MTSKAKWQKICFVMSLVIATTASAQTQTAVAPVTIFSGGWGSDEFAINTSAPFTNPAHCTNTDLYDMSSTNGGYKTLLATALSAITSRQNVSITVSNTACSSTNRPLLIGIAIIP